MNYESEKLEIEKRLETTNDFVERMELLDEIFSLKLKYGLVTISDFGDTIECVGCGS